MKPGKVQVLAHENIIPLSPNKSYPLRLRGELRAHPPNAQQRVALSSAPLQDGVLVGAQLPPSLHWGMPVENLDISAPNFRDLKTFLGLGHRTGLVCDKLRITLCCSVGFSFHLFSSVAHTTTLSEKTLLKTDSSLNYHRLIIFNKQIAIHRYGICPEKNFRQSYNITNIVPYF